MSVLALDKVLVTGGAGFIGSGLVKLLSAEGVEVRVFDDLSRGSFNRLLGCSDRIEFINGDIRDPELVDRAVCGVDVVYHLAGINGTRNFYERPLDVLNVNIRGTMNVLESANKYGVTRLLFASSSEVYHQPEHLPTTEAEMLRVPDIRNPRFSYSVSKIAGEALCLNYDRMGLVNCVVVRYHNIYGPDMGSEHVIPDLVFRMLDAGRAGYKSLTLFCDSDDSRAFCYIDDAIKGSYIASKSGRGGEIYNIGDPGGYLKIVELGQLLNECLGLDLSFRFEAGAVGAPSKRCPSIDKLQRLGYSPRVSLSEGLSLATRWYKSVWLKARDG